MVFRLDCGLNDLADSINSNQYTEKKGVGVISGSIDRDSVNATFVEKKKVYDEINYPDGETETLERYKYIYYSFKAQAISDKHYLFQLINPPVSIKCFVEFLSKFHPSLAVEKFKFDLPGFHKSIKRNPRVERARVTSLKASSLPFSEKSAAKIEIFSETDSYRELKRVYGEKGYRLDRLVFTISAGGGDYELLASASGAISYSEPLDKSIVIDSFVSSISY
ncbi:MAG: hypothetical protein AB3N14_21465 [Flavobacteriaceae bacterium]